MWEGVLKYGATIVEDSHAMVEGLYGQLFLRVLVYGLTERGGRQGNGGERHMGRISGSLRLFEEGGDFAGDSGPAVLFNRDIAHGGGRE